MSRQRTAASRERARELYEAALEIDPRYAGAWAGMARNHVDMANDDLLPLEDGLRFGREAAERALAIDPGSAEAYAVLGAAAWLDNDRAATLRNYE